MRFISEDTNKGKIGEPLTLNLYTYCEGNPVNYIDPMGHYKCSAVGDGGYDTGTTVNQTVWQKIANTPIEEMNKPLVKVNLIGDGAIKVENGQINLNLCKNEQELSQTIDAAAMIPPVGVAGALAKGAKAVEEINYVNRTSKSFWKSYWKLPAQLRDKADEMYQLYKQNPNHPSLNFEDLGLEGKFFSIRINDKYRAYGRKLLDGAIEWVDINGHDYKEAIRRLKNMK